MSWTAAVAGATGYAGGEVLRLLASHPYLEIGALTASSSAGTRLGEHHPHLAALARRRVEPTDVAHLLDHDVVVLALPHGASGAVTAALEEAGAAAGHTPLLLDCGADHRLSSARAWEDYYGPGFCPPWTYGMPELLHAGETTATAQRRALASTRHVAVPGCNVTAVTLAVQPGVAAGLLDPGALTAVLAVGYSGAGRALKPHLTASAALGGAQPYAVGGTHRHIPEVVQNLEVAGAPAGSVRLSLTPVLVPMSRGILATVTAPVSEAVAGAPDPQALLRAPWEAAYGPAGTADGTQGAEGAPASGPGVPASGEPAPASGPGAPADGEPAPTRGEALVNLLEPGTWPTTGEVLGSGLATVQVTYDARAGVATMLCAIDNLGKGTASAALQCLNLALGLPEDTGVITEGVAP
ncbi:N-acetyl-gamma-glutamyl-phosphate reductase [Actinomyces sp. HMT897]|uniref:N-acetyl-gamma-glutamyl-phosphate reductase n=1 Tax=Actinomyces sp. HMT897 TaxID=2789424 RepID=UPI001FED6477|nr:N-acetyl-gamma-glutamyl-phosphate reductase [Actinomyces sp. HMT897]